MSDDYSEAWNNEIGQSDDDSSMKAAGNLPKAKTPWGFFSLLKHASLLKDMPFVSAFGFAILKDITDFIFNETVILGIVFSIICSIFIFMMLLLVGSGSKRGSANGLLKKGGVLMVGGVVDSLPGLGFFPTETATVLTVYLMTLQERANAEE